MTSSGGEVLLGLNGEYLRASECSDRPWFEENPGHGRYTDIWAKRDGRWVAVAAHVTRC